MNWINKIKDISVRVLQTRTVTYHSILYTGQGGYDDGYELKNSQQGSVDPCQSGRYPSYSWVQSQSFGCTVSSYLPWVLLQKAFSIIGIFVPGDEGKCSFEHFCHILAHFQPTRENTPDTMPNSAVSKIRLVFRLFDMSNNGTISKEW